MGEHDVVLKELLEIFDSKTRFILSHRRNQTEKWKKNEGNRVDNEILRWMDCIVTAVKWEKGKPVQIAVEGEPYAWGDTN